jgi:hypothetical protein
MSRILKQFELASVHRTRSERIHKPAAQVNNSDTVNEAGMNDEQKAQHNISHGVTNFLAAGM